MKNKLLAAIEEEAAGMKLKIDNLEKGIAKDNKEIIDVDKEKRVAKEEEDNANNINIKDKVNNYIDSVERPKGDDLNKP